MILFSLLLFKGTISHFMQWHSFGHAHTFVKKKLFPSNPGAVTLADFCASEAYESFKTVRPAVIRADHNQCHMSAEHVTENHCALQYKHKPGVCRRVFGAREERERCICRKNKTQHKCWTPYRPDI